MFEERLRRRDMATTFGAPCRNVVCGASDSGCDEQACEKRLLYMILYPDGCGMESRRLPLGCFHNIARTVIAYREQCELQPEPPLRSELKKDFNRFTSKARDFRILLEQERDGWTLSAMELALARQKGGNAWDVRGSVARLIAQLQELESLESATAIVLDSIPVGAPVHPAIRNIGLDIRAAFEAHGVPLSLDADGYFMLVLSTVVKWLLPDSTPDSLRAHADWVLNATPRTLTLADVADIDLAV